MINNIYKNRIKQVNNSSSIIQGSTPVLFFGNIEKSKVATISLNPSHHEFLNNGNLLFGEEQRLESLNSLNVDSLQDLDEQKMKKIYESCLNYFKEELGGKPYKNWFNPFNDIIKESLGFDYYQDTCCHLDLVQWATYQVWAELESEERKKLLESDLPFLKELIIANKFDFLLLNGKTTYSNVISLIGGKLISEVLKYDGFADTNNHNGLKVWCSIIKFNTEIVKLVGWNRYLQRGISNYERLKLVETIKKVYQEPAYIPW